MRGERQSDEDSQSDVDDDMEDEKRRQSDESEADDGSDSQSEADDETEDENRDGHNVKWAPCNNVPVLAKDMLARLGEAMETMDLGDVKKSYYVFVERVAKVYDACREIEGSSGSDMHEDRDKDCFHAIQVSSVLIIITSVQLIITSVQLITTSSLVVITSSLIMITSVQLNVLTDVSNM